MQNRTLLERRGIAAVVSLGFFIAAAIVAERAASQSQTEQPQPESEVVAPEAPAPDTAPPPRAAEAPLETTGRVPTLDYEPTEAISEDKSVSFPVDI